MDFSGQTFANCAVDIDGNSYRDCRFHNVVFNYNGGSIEVSGCTFDNLPTWNLGGDLGNGLQALRTFAHDAGPATVRNTVNSFTAFFRRKQSPVVFKLD